MLWLDLTKDIPILILNPDFIDNVAGNAQVHPVPVLAPEVVNVKAGNSEESLSLSCLSFVKLLAEFHQILPQGGELEVALADVVQSNPTS